MGQLPVPPGISLPGRPAARSALHPGEGQRRFSLDRIDWELERLSPPAHRGGTVPLRPHRRCYLVGRSQRCDVRLFTATASRQHAELRRDAEGVWWLTPVAGKLVLADGEPVEGECELCEGLNLVLGEDRLRCGRPQSESEAETEALRSTSGVAVSRRAVLVATGLLLLLMLGLVLLRVSA